MAQQTKIVKDKVGLGNLDKMLQYAQLCAEIRCLHGQKPPNFPQHSPAMGIRIRLVELFTGARHARHVKSSPRSFLGRFSALFRARAYHLSRHYSLRPTCVKSSFRLLSVARALFHA
jgi:hypothetical protein